MGPVTGAGWPPGSCLPFSRATTYCVCSLLAAAASHNTPLRAPRTPNRPPPPAHSRRPRRAAPGPRPPAAAPPPPSAAAWAAAGLALFFFPPRPGVTGVRGGEWNLPAAFTLAQTVSKQDGPIGGTSLVVFWSGFLFFFFLGEDFGEHGPGGARSPPPCRGGWRGGAAVQRHTTGRGGEGRGRQFCLLKVRSRRQPISGELPFCFRY